MLHLLTEVCGAALINAALPSLVLVVLAYALMSLRGWSATTRYFAWWLTLWLVVLLPFCPSLRRSSNPVSSAVPVVHIRSVDVAPDKTMVVLPRPSAPGLQFSALADAAAIVCAGVVLLELLRLAYGFITARRLKRNARACTDGRVLELFTEAHKRLKLRRAVDLRLADTIGSPLTVGYFHPAVIFPAALIGKLNSQEIEQVLAHELAHIARYDDWALALQRLLQVLFAFHPLVRFIGWRMSLDREIACDDRIIVSREPVQYAACLAKIAEFAWFDSRVAVTLPLLTGRKSSLARRIETMLDKTRSHMPTLSPGRAFVFTALGVAVAIAGLWVPVLIASPLADLPVDQIGPIVMTSPQGSAFSFEENNTQSSRDSAFPNATIVFKRHGKSYIIRDRGTVDAANKLMEPMNELSRKQEELGAQQEKLGEQQQKLGEQMEGMANREMNVAMKKQLQEQLRLIEEKLHSLNMDKAMKSAADAQEQVSALQAQLGELAARLGEEQGKLGEAQGKLGEEQGGLGEQQGKLGEQQGRLGEQQGREAKRIERELKDLIERAEKQGLAQPLQ